MKRTVWQWMVLSVAVGLGWIAPASGAQFFTDAGGPLTWDNAAGNWADASGGPYGGVWASGDAVFEGTAGTVAVGTVSANSLAFSVAGYTLTGGVVTLTGPLIAASNNATINSFIAGSAGLTKSGAGGTLTLGGTNTYSGGTTVSGGTLAVSADNQLGLASEGITLAGGTLRVNGTLNTLTRPLALGAGGGTISLGTWLNYNGAITGGTGIAVGGSDFIMQPPSANNMGFFTLNGSRLFVNNANAIANNATLNITGTGRLVFQSSAAPTAPANPISFANGCGVGMRSSTTADLTLSTTTATFPASGSFVFNNDDQATRGITVNGTWPALTGALNLQVGGGHTNVGAITINATLSGASALTKSNPGVLILAASNTFSGGLIVDSGIVKLGHSNGLGASSGLLTVKNGAKLDLAGFSPRVTGLSDTLGFGVLGTACITNTGAEATLTIVRTNQAFAGTIAGPINLVIPTGGLSYQILSGTNTYTGVTTVYGSLEAWGTNALGSTSVGTIITNGAALALKGMTEPMTYAPEPLTFYGGTQFSLNTDGTLRNATWTGPITLAQGAAVTVTRGGFTNGSITIQSVITGGGSLSKTDATLLLTLSGTNDYSGGTTLTVGTLKLGNASALGSGPVTVNGGLLDLNGTSVTMGSLGGTGGAIVDLSAGAGITTLTVTQAVNATCTTPISNGVAKTVSFVKTGNGILTLSNTNTFAGAVTISGGTLKLGVASAFTSTVVTVTSGGTLDMNSQNFLVGSRTLVISGPGAAGQSGALVNTGPGNEASVVNLTLAGNAAVGATGNKLNVYGTLNGGGNVLTVGGTGETNIRLDNGLQNLAGITVNSGLLRLESSQNWTGTYTVNAGGKLDTYGTRTEAGSVNLNGGRLVNGGTGAMPATWTGAISLTGTSVVDTTGGNITISNAVSGAGALTKIGTNTLALCGACSFGDALSVSNGTVTLSGSLANGNVTIASGATVSGSGTVHSRVVNGVKDTMVVRGTLNLTSLTLDLDVTGALGGKGPFTLVDATGGTLVGRFATVRDVPTGYAVVYEGAKVVLRASGTLIKVN